MVNTKELKEVMVQNAKDTFYEMLRSRVVALNPERTIVLRGIVRPGVLVEENELLSAVALPDCFRGSGGPWRKSMQMATCHWSHLRCTIDYETAGTGMNGGMDRGRALATMDAELQRGGMLCRKNVLKMNYAGLASGKTAVEMGTSVWVE